MANLSSSSSILIRPATLDDAEAIATVGAKSFNETFAFSVTPEQMSNYLATAYAPQTVAERLSNPTYSYLVAQSSPKGPVVGFVSTTITSTEDAYNFLKPYPDLVAINRLYVDSSYHGGGVGQALLDAALEEVRGKGRKSVWLGVYPQNPRAIRFYAKNGFRKVGEHSFVFSGGDRVDIDDVMVKEL